MQFRYCENIEHTYTNPDGVAHYSLRLQSSVLSYYTEYHSAGICITIVSVCLHTAKIRTDAIKIQYKRYKMARLCRALRMTEFADPEGSMSSQGVSGGGEWEDGRHCSSLLYTYAALNLPDHFSSIVN